MPNQERQLKNKSFKPGAMFYSVWMVAGSLVTVLSVDEANNKLEVECSSPNGICWTETDWNLQHCIAAEQKNEYRFLKTSLLVFFPEQWGLDEVNQWYKADPARYEVVRLDQSPDQRFILKGWV